MTTPKGPYTVADISSRSGTARYAVRSSLDVKLVDSTQTGSRQRVDDWCARLNAAYLAGYAAARAEWNAQHSPETAPTVQSNTHGKPLESLSALELANELTCAVANACMHSAHTRMFDASTPTAPIIAIGKEFVRRLAAQAEAEELAKAADAVVKDYADANEQRFDELKWDAFNDAGEIDGLARALARWRESSK